MSVPMCVHMHAGGRGQASGEQPVAGSIECCLHLAREGALTLGRPAQRFVTKTEGAVWLRSHISGLWKFLNF